MSNILVELLDKKIEQFDRFREITAKMLEAEFDDLEELMEEREKIVNVVDGISLEMNGYINEQFAERQEQINAVLSLSDVANINDELLELQKKARQYDEVRIVTMELDKKAYNRLKAMQDNLIAEMGEKSVKPQQVANYFSNAAIDLTKGSRFNAKN